MEITEMYGTRSLTGFKGLTQYSRTKYDQMVDMTDTYEGVRFGYDEPRLAKQASFMTHEKLERIIANTEVECSNM